MNVNDYNEKLPDGDLLKAIFARQQQLIEKYHDIEAKNTGLDIPANPVDLNDRASQLRIKDFMWRITEELGEAANCLKLKPWKSTPMVTDEVHFLEEMIDAFHFMIELLIMVGFTPESLTQMYLNKAAVNSFRQTSNY